MQLSEEQGSLAAYLYHIWRQEGKKTRISAEGTILSTNCVRTSIFTKGIKSRVRQRVCPLHSNCTSKMQAFDIEFLLSDIYILKIKNKGRKADNSRIV